MVADSEPGDNCSCTDRMPDRRSLDSLDLPLVMEGEIEGELASMMSERLVDCCSSRTGHRGNLAGSLAAYTTDLLETYSLQQNSWRIVVVVMKSSSTLNRDRTS